MIFRRPSKLWLQRVEQRMHASDQAAINSGKNLKTASFSDEEQLVENQSNAVKLQ